MRRAPTVAPREDSTRLAALNHDSQGLDYRPNASGPRMITSDRVRPVFVHIEAHVRAYVFLCMLAYYVEWYVRWRLAPILFDEDDLEAAKAQRASPVEPTKPSPSARSKVANKRTPDVEPTHSLHTLLADLSTIALNESPSADPEASRWSRPYARAEEGLQAAGRRSGWNVPNRWQVGIQESPCRKGKTAILPREVQPSAVPAQGLVFRAPVG